MDKFLIKLTGSKSQEEKISERPVNDLCNPIKFAVTADVHNDVYGNVVPVPGLPAAKRFKPRTKVANVQMYPDFEEITVISSLNETQVMKPSSVRSENVMSSLNETQVMKPSLGSAVLPDSGLIVSVRSKYDDQAPEKEDDCTERCELNENNLNNIVDVGVCSASSADTNNLDIGLARKNSKLSDSDRLVLLTTNWVPPKGFKWPYSLRTSKGLPTKRYLGITHFQGIYSCFSYSLSKSGVFCTPCVMFAPNSVGGVELGRLIVSPLQVYSHLSGKEGSLTRHVQKPYHEDSVEAAKQFFSCTKQRTDVARQINTAAATEIEKNRNALKRILLAVEYHGRLGLSLRGHRDSGHLHNHFTLPEAEESDDDISKRRCDTSATSIDYTQGNFRATLQLMLQCNDGVLRQHFSSARKNATYISSVSQNALIEAIATVIKRNIIESIHRARFYSIIADETTDFSRQEQLTVCFRYVLDCSVYERFFCFAIAPDLTGKGLANQLLAIVQNAGLNKLDMVGQGYDGAAAMSGQHNGVQKYMLLECPSAVYVHCVSHSLNLCLVKAAEVPEVRAAVTLMHEIAIFYCESNKRLRNLQEHIEIKCPESNRTRLKKHCTTRWVEKQDAVHVFKELYPAVISSLQELSLWSGETGNKAITYIRALDGSFVVGMETVNMVLQVTKPLSEKLQSKSHDIQSAIDSVTDCSSVLQKMREDDTFKSIYTSAESIHGEEIMRPRLAAAQRNRCNVPADSAEEYYRRACFLPFVDTCLAQLKERFNRHSSTAFGISAVLPSLLDTANFSDVEQAAAVFSHLLPGDGVALKVEYMRWKAYWDRQPQAVKRPETVLQALRTASTLGTYPVLSALLTIFGTLPVTTATGERSFSSLKFIKNYLRSTMGEERLNGLAHMFINRDIVLNYDSVIDEFGPNRRLVFNK